MEDLYSQLLSQAVLSENTLMNAINRNSGSSGGSGGRNITVSSGTLQQAMAMGSIASYNLESNNLSDGATSYRTSRGTTGWSNPWDNYSTPELRQPYNKNCYEVLYQGKWCEMPASYNGHIRAGWRPDKYILNKLFRKDKQHAFFRVLTEDISTKELYDILKNKKNEVEGQNGTTAYTTSYTRTNGWANSLSNEANDGFN